MVVGANARLVGKEDVRPSTLGGLLNRGKLPLQPRLDQLRIALIGTRQRPLRRQPELAQQSAHRDLREPHLKAAADQLSHHVACPQRKLKLQLHRISRGHRLVNPADRLAIEQAASELKNALKSDDIERIKRSSEALTQVSHKLAEEVYKKTQGTKAQQTADSTQQTADSGQRTEDAAGKDDKVVDAEFKVQDEK